ncbi:MAG: hypothetical protein KC609_20470 [Myxococcales bacterium]|nr:hypothetical protein [Myxococcales bacterium]
MTTRTDEKRTDRRALRDHNANDHGARRDDEPRGDESSDDLETLRALSGELEALRDAHAGNVALAGAIGNVRRQIGRILRHSGAPDEHDAVQDALSLIATHEVGADLLGPLRALGDASLANGGWTAELELLDAVVVALRQRGALDVARSLLGERLAPEVGPAIRLDPIETAADDAARLRRLALRGLLLEIALERADPDTPFAETIEELVESGLHRLAIRLLLAHSMASVEAARHTDAVQAVETARAIAVEAVDFLSYTVVSIGLFLLHESQGELDAAFAVLVRAVASLEEGLGGIDPTIGRIRSWLESLPERWGSATFERVARSHLGNPLRETRESKG